MRTNAIQTVLVLLGLGITAGPAFASPIFPVAAMAVGQTDSADARRQTDELLRRARVAMKGGNLELAERYLGEAEKLDVPHDGLLSRFADTPLKLRKELDRVKQGAQPGNRLSNLLGKKPNPLQQTPPAPIQGAPQRLPSESNRSATTVPQGNVAYPSTNVGAPMLDASLGSPEVRATNARRLMAQSSAALGRGDLVLAENLARQADHLRVAENAFAGGDTPWEMLMKVNKQRRLQGVVPATATGSENKVAPALYDANQDNTFVRTASAEQPVSPGVNALAQQVTVPGLQPLPGQPAPISDGVRAGTFNSSGTTALPAAPLGPGQFAAQPTYAEVPSTDNSASVESIDASPESFSPEASALPNPSINTTASGVAPVELMKLGEQSLRDGDLDEARDYFRQAWAYEAEMDQASRQRLQDHLQLLRSGEPTDSKESDEDQEEQLRIRRFISEISREQSAIARDLRSNPKDAWERMKRLRSRVLDADLPDGVRKPLVARLDRAVTETEQYIEQNRAQIELDERNREVLAAIDRDRKMQADIENKLARMVEEFNELMKQQRFSEAFVLSKQARELDPRNPVVENMVWKSRTAGNLLKELAIRERYEYGYERSLESALESGVPFDDRNPISFSKDWDRLKHRQGLEDTRSRYTEVELEIQRSLRKKVQVQFDEQPLAEVINTLGRMAGINVYLDTQGLAAEGVTSDTPISMNLSQEISLQSVLNLILEPLRLGYLIQDEVLRITSEQARAGDVFDKIYYVGDLVIPIPNFAPGYNNGMAGALAQAHAALRPGFAANPAPPLAVVADNEESGSKGLGRNASALAQMSAASMLSGSQQPQPMGFGPGGLGGASGADFDTLMDLISQTVAPDSWNDVGGPGTMAPFEGNLSLVISTTQEVHDEIVDLLEQLRRLQDLQVTIEVRFITLQDNFFERIGVDFDFRIEDGSGLTQAQVANDIDDFGPSVTVGLDPTGTPTVDLDLAFSQNSFASALPTFGGFDPGTASTFGFAILSDIEAFFVLEAIQGDSRTNVMAAPKLTLFNGQLAILNDTTTRPFVTSVIPVVGDFAVAQQPVILVLAEGTQLNVQAVVSSDRRFVRMTLLPMFSQIGDVDTFTFEGRRSSTTGSTTEVDPAADTSTTARNNEEFTEGTTVQLPAFSVTSVSTTVSVPDGGTVLMGGLKRLAEGRNERGTPIVSKIPYVNRLFRNVGIGRETQTLMMMVTPRIIIQEEEEERVLGSQP